MSILGRDFPSREDENLQGVQTTIVSAAIPTVSLLADLVKQGFTGQLDELAPVQEAIWIPWQSLVLIGQLAFPLSRWGQGLLLLWNLRDQS